jgi:hypothetical protein
MKRRMLDLSVYTDSDNLIFIEQSDSDEISTTTVTPEQVPTFICWLEEAAAELHERIPRGTNDDTDK